MENNTSQIDKYATQFIGKEVEIKIDRPLHSKHPKHGFVYEVNYGFVPDTKAPDGEEIDAYLLGVDMPVDTYKGKCIAVIHRLNDTDDKLIIVPTSSEDINDEEIKKATYFQEQFFISEIIRKTVE
ncbi:MAG: inorganic pyrophosphatase [Candidatus Moranbacteria bacterium CG_4_10_14_3_um_filter_41_65]|nr:MAG: inorganic pyrophosphatase [Candidatus Moranbacteria bacterium CG2_30_41_165]PIP25360.1 MAG: inorganic pyrophosphatase [Candidatus Moranbacteria bacterium CG23_combo_of_CG06-09_8_20_14_all_41_28]PIV86306.1 MAG: inorganic pyrophosphatase [Candidatus Moranbacteria bacterium CG17_big_fil_post_rev_8_21_14_2_50_41_107]PIW93918.1 MAG: inorganic pyrophosphatase [Candidatus Moranbacteria bacterium CG_4_8_14_3_um_filter_41_13]PIX91959.1 MAG: inorganic pyrophosphatase [Candidatus Moranbacteria bac